MARTEVDADTLEIVERTLQQLWGAVNELSLVHPRAERYRVTLFGSARLAPGSPDYVAAFRLAERLAADGCDVVTGGGPGLMEAANAGATAGDPENLTASVGIRIALPFEQGANPFVEKLYTHRSFFTRLHQFVRASDAYVVLPGGVGTTLETVMVWQLLQVRHLEDVPLVLVGPMWRELVDWARTHMTGHEPPLASPDDFELPTCVDDIDAAVEVVVGHHRRWSERRAHGESTAD